MKALNTTVKKTSTATFPKLWFSGAESFFKVIESYVNKSSKILDTIAGWGLFTVTFLTVINIIMRTAFKRPLLGTYDYVGFLTSITVSFSLAWCAVQNGHIAIEFILEKFSKLTQNIIEIINQVIMFILVCVSTGGLFIQASKLKISGEVSATARVPSHYFVLASAIGFLLLGCVIFTKIIRAIKGARVNEC